jgi:hypothetical protein
MPYMLLIVEPPGQREERGLEGGKQAYQTMLDFTETMKSAGVLLASSALSTPSSRLQLQGGQTRWLDGPFTEAKEMIGGFFLLNCSTRKEAMAWAERCPAAAYCTVEVRETGPCFL